MNFNAIDAIQEIYMDLPHDHIRFIINELCKKGVEIYSQIVRIALNAVGYSYFDLIFYEYISEPFDSGEVYGVFVDTCNYNFDILTHSFLNFKD